MGGAIAQVTYETSSSNSGALIGLYLGFGILAYILAAIAFAGVFKKAGQPVWPAFIPIVNYYFLMKVIGRGIGWFLLVVICPIFLIVVFYDLARSFGHGLGFTIGLILLPMIFLLILGFGSSQYQGPAALMPPGTV